MQTNMANSMNSSVDIGKSFNDMAGWAQTAYDKIKSVAGGAIGSIQTWWAGLTTYQKDELKKQTQNNAGTSQQIEETWFEAFNKMHQFGETLFEGMNTAMNDMVKGVTDSLTTGAADWRSITSKALSGMLDSVIQWGIKYLEVQLDIAKAFSFLDANPLLAIPLIVGLIGAVSALGMPAMANGAVFDQATAVIVGDFACN
jgi:phage-related minor tail protein